MPYLVLALGAFLSICGALSIVYGYGIVQVERGWTSVIAGASALSGGVVTMALGLVLRALLDLRAGFADRPAMAAQGAVAPHESAEADIGHDLAPPQPLAERPSLMTAELESGMLAAIMSVRPDDARHEDQRHDEHHPDVPALAEHGLERAEVRPVHINELLETQYRDEIFEQPARPHQEHLHQEHLHQEIVAFAPPIPPLETRPPEEPTAEKPRFKVSFKRQPPATIDPDPAPVPVPTAEPEAPAMDDWLDRAFSALDHEVPTPPIRASRLAEPSVVETAPPEHEMAHADHAPPAAEAAATVHHEPESEPVEPPRPAPPVPPPATAAVIGRYEADGTSYVMYADGSIDAQSDAGAYRFNSMAELKAFIESTE